MGSVTVVFAGMSARARVLRVMRVLDVARAVIKRRKSTAFIMKNQLNAKIC